MTEKIQLNDLLPEFTFADKARGISVRTAKKNSKFLLMFFRYLAEHHSVETLDKVTTRQIRGFLLFKREQGCDESYVNSFLRSIRAFFRYCEEEDYILVAENPCLRVKWMKEQQKVVKAYSVSDVEKMLRVTRQNASKKYSDRRGLASKYFAERDRLLLMTLTDTGLRISECLKLTDQTFTEFGIKVIRGKGKKDRFVYTSSALMKQKYKYDRSKKQYFDSKNMKCEDYVFLSKAGKQYTVDMAQRTIKKIGLAAGIDESVRCSPHTFRHFFTQAQLANGADIYTLQRLLGHSSVKTTEHYLASLSSEVTISKGLESSPLMNMKL